MTEGTRGYTGSLRIPSIKDGKGMKIRKRARQGETYPTRGTGMNTVRMSRKGGTNHSDGGPSTGTKEDDPQ